MGQVTHLFDKRELAIVIWILVVLIVLLIRKQTRASLGGVARAASTPKIAIPLCLMVLYVGAVVLGLRAAGFWTLNLVSETVFWLVGTGFVFFFQYDRVSDDSRFFRRTLLRALSVTVALEFLVNLFNFSLLAELVLVLILVILGATLAVSATRDEFVRVHGCLGRAVATAGFGLLLYSILRAAESFSSVATIETVRELSTPAVLTACFLPFVYALGVYGNYDGLLARLGWLAADDHELYRYMRRRVFLTAGIRLRAVLRCAHAPWMVILSRPPTRAEVDRAVEHIRARTSNALAMSTASTERIAQLVVEEPPGWEYMLFAARLEAGQPAVAQDQSSTDEAGRAFETPRNERKAIQGIQEDNRDALSIVGNLERIFDGNDVVEAFGAPGAQGDARRIIALAERLILIHDRMLRWSNGAHSSRTCDKFAPLVQMHAALLDKPNQQVDAYISRWVEIGYELPDLIDAVEQGTSKLELDMSLVITIDDDLRGRFEAEAARLRQEAA